jgi:cytochrome oxidase Cu insertion factor (SCO1/SenC/PrrC family)
MRGPFALYALVVLLGLALYGCNHFRSLRMSARPEVAMASGPAVGQVAPDIEGDDLDGVPFKLSDYRGKVVVLDFWGNW